MHLIPTMPNFSYVINKKRYQINSEAPHAKQILEILSDIDKGKLTILDDIFFVKSDNHKKHICFEADGFCYFIITKDNKILYHPV